MSDAIQEQAALRPAGYTALIERYGLVVIPNWHRSLVTTSGIHRSARLDTCPTLQLCQLSGFPGSLTTAWQVFRPRRGPGVWPHSPESTERLLFRAGFGTSVVGTRTVWPFRRYRSGAVLAPRRRMRGNRQAKEQR
jgi:hypothetical protein